MPTHDKSDPEVRSDPRIPCLPRWRGHRIRACPTAGAKFNGLLGSSVADPLRNTLRDEAAHLQKLRV